MLLIIGLWSPTRTPAGMCSNPLFQAWASPGIAVSCFFLCVKQLLNLGLVVCALNAQEFWSIDKSRQGHPIAGR